MFLIRLHYNAESDPAQQQQILIFKKNPYFAGPAQSVSSAFYLEDPDPEDLPSINIESGTLDLTFSIC